MLYAFNMGTFLLALLVISNIIFLFLAFFLWQKKTAVSATLLGTNTQLEANTAALEQAAHENNNLKISIKDATVNINALEKRIIGLEAEQKASSFYQNSLISENNNFKIIIEKKALIINELERRAASLETEKKTFSFYQDNLQGNFEQLAKKVFDNNSHNFKEKSSLDIKALLEPFKNKIAEFEKRIEDSFNSDIKERYSLSREIGKMASQTDKMIAETTTLSRALRGESKTQGAWGELILSKVLEHSGLQKDRDYTMQYKLENNTIPDVVINLPDSKHLIIDAKTSLKHYDLYINSNEAEYLKDFLQSIKAHIKNLSGKKYYNNTQLLNPGFVFMFIPIESAYALALSQDLELKTFALKNRIIIVSPNSLIAMLQTVSSVWRIVEQNKNATEIAYKAGMMYDKLVNFVEDIKRIGSSIIQLEKNYNEALNKLSIGKGNLIKKAEELKIMGIDTKKQINEDFPQ